MTVVAKTAGMGGDSSGTTGSVNVLTPGQQTPPPTDVEGSDASGGGTSTTSITAPNVGQSSVEASSTGPSTNKTAPKASSGMFTNIQKYVQKNKPQAQKMSQSVQQNVGTKASDIREATQEKVQTTNDRLAANQVLMDQQRANAQATVDQIMAAPQPAPTTATPTVDSSSESRNMTTMGPTTTEPATQTTDQQVTTQPTTQPTQQGTVLSASEFQRLVGGDIAGIQQVDGVNLAQENFKAQALKRMTDQARGEAGRRALLRDTFAQGENYTRGMSGLDNLILGGDRQIASNFINTVQKQGRDIATDTRDQQAAIRQGITAQSGALDAFGGDIEKIATSERDPMMKKIKDDFNQQLIERATMTGNMELLSDEIQANLTPEQKAAIEAGDIASLRAFSSRLKDASSTTVPTTINTDYKRIYTGDVSNNPLFNLSQDVYDYHGITQEDIDKAIQAAAGMQGRAHMHGSISSAEQAYLDSLNPFKRLASANQSLDDQIREAGYSYDDIYQGSDISMGDIAGATQTTQINRLNELLNENARIEADDTGYMDREALENIFNRYRQS